MKPVKYKAWLHIESLDKNGDQVEGDDVFEPTECFCAKSRSDIIYFKNITVAYTKFFQEIYLK